MLTNHLATVTLLFFFIAMWPKANAQDCNTHLGDDTAEYSFAYRANRCEGLISEFVSLAGNSSYEIRSWTISKDYQPGSSTTSLVVNWSGNSGAVTKVEALPLCKDETCQKYRMSAKKSGTQFEWPDDILRHYSIGVEDIGIRCSGVIKMLDEDLPALFPAVLHQQGGGTTNSSEYELAVWTYDDLSSLSYYVSYVKEDGDLETVIEKQTLNDGFTNNSVIKIKIPFASLPKNGVYYLNISVDPKVGFAADEQFYFEHQP